MVTVDYDNIVDLVYTKEVTGQGHLHLHKYFSQYALLFTPLFKIWGFAL